VTLSLLLCRYDPVLSGRVNGDDDTAQRRERRVPATVRGRRTGGDMIGTAPPRYSSSDEHGRKRVAQGGRFALKYETHSLALARDAVVKHNDRAANRDDK